jgi:hypothetical protein
VSEPLAMGPSPGVDPRNRLVCLRTGLPYEQASDIYVQYFRTDLTEAEFSGLFERKLAYLLPPDLSFRNVSDGSVVEYWLFFLGCVVKYSLLFLGCLV